MKFVPNSLCEQLLVYFRYPSCKAVFVLLPAVYVNSFGLDLCLALPRQVEGIILLPVRAIDRIAKNLAQQVGKRPHIPKIGIHFARRFGDECRALRAHGGKKLGMRKGKSQRAITAHGKSGYASRFPVANHVEVRFYVRQELGEKKIAVTIMPVSRIYEETASPLRRDHQEISDLVLLPEIFDQSPTAGSQKGLLVFAQSVQKIQDGVFLAGFFLVAGREHHAIMNATMQDVALKGAAIDPALAQGKGRDKGEERQNKTRKSSQALAGIPLWTSVEPLCPLW